MKHTFRLPLAVMALALAAFLAAGFHAAAQEKTPTLKVRGDRNYPPYEFIENGQPTGFNIDLIREVAQVLGLAVEIELGPWDEVRTELENGQIDVLAGMYFSPERDKKVDFSIPHTIVSFGMFVRSNSPARGLADVQGQTVIVQQGDIMHDHLRAEGLTPEIITLPDAPDVLRALAAGQAEAAFLPKMQGLYVAQKYNLTNILLVGDGLLPRDYAFAVTEGNDRLAAQLNEGLNILKATGRYRAIQEKWFGVYEPRPFSNILAEYGWVFGLILLLLGGSLVWALLLRRQVNRRMAELNQSEKLFRLLFEQAPIGMALTSLKGRYLQVNQAFCDTLGYTAEELHLRPFAEISHPDDMPANLAYIEQITRGEFAHFQMEKRYFSKQGQIIHTLLQVMLMRDAARQPLYYLAQVVDVTPQKQTQLALEESQARLAGIIGSAMDAIITIDEAQTIVLFNAAAEIMFGCLATQVLGQPLDRFIPEQHRTRHANHIRAFGATGETTRQMGKLGEIQGVRANGALFPIEASISQIQTGQGKFFTVILRDITQRRQAEHAAAQSRLELEKQRAFLRQVVDSSPNHIFVKDRHNRFLLVNQAMAEGYNTTVEAMIGGTSTDFNPDSEEVAFFHKIDQVVFETGREQLIPEEKVTYVDGTVHWMQTVKRPIFDEDGRVERLLGVAVDITHRKNLEEQLRHSQKIEAIGRLAGGIAHDFNNLLTVITGYVELLLLRHEDEADPDHREIMQIRKMANRATALTRQLLAFSRQQVLQPEVLALNEVVSNMGQILHRLISEEIELRTILDPHPGYIKADPGQLEQVILNLVINARDAMPHGGLITLETATVELDEAYARQNMGVIPGPYVLLAISDTGEGMDETTQAHIFEPFFTTKEVGQGTGLGLATVHGIVNQSGGHIWVYSEPGRGTIFKVYLPRVQLEPAASAKQLKSGGAAGGSETVLLVEDEAEVRNLAREVLQRQGYLVLEAGDGPAAIELCKKHPGSIDVLLTDVIMPKGFSGLELAQYLGPAYPAMKVLFMSGYTDNALAHHEGLKPGAAFLEKPFTPETLARKLRQVLDGE